MLEAIQICILYEMLLWHSFSILNMENRFFSTVNKLSGSVKLVSLKPHKYAFNLCECVVLELFSLRLKTHHMIKLEKTLIRTAYKHLVSFFGIRL